YDPTGTTAHVVTDTTNETKTTYNVIAETAKGESSNVVMAGAHLDSVDGGAGINDNGSGTAGILAIAEALAKEKKLTNKVRFGFWGAEEAGLLGSQHWVYDQYDNNPAALEDIALYLNFDMIGSPNYVRFVYDGDNSMGGGVEGPEGSAQIEQLFTKYFSSVGLASEETEFSGRSDYGPFLEVGIPSGGLFTGAEGVKTEEQAAIYGGTAGDWYDPCYHQACDDRDNVSADGIDEMSDAAAHAVYTLAQSTYAVNGEGKH
ncbi:MAG: M28 family peptidase, partial [Myxococcales bacterium]